MVPILQLSLRQLSGKWRITVIALLAALPVAIVAAGRAFGGDASDDIDEGARLILDGIIVGAVMPIVTMTLATASFGNEVEDRTLGYLTLNPVSRWSIVLSKMLAPVVIAGPVLVISGIVVVLVGFEGGPRTAAAVGVGLLAGVVTYSAIFAWAGLVTSHALGFALVYLLLWEGLLSSLLSGVRYLSVRAYVLTLMEGIDDSRLDMFQDFTIELTAAVGGIVFVSAAFFWLAVRRLRGMDVL